MEHNCSTGCSSCESGCPTPFVCHCLEVTEGVIVQAITGLGIDNLKDLRQHTGAGAGCNACHKRLRVYLEQYVGIPQPRRVPVPVVS